MSSPKEHLIPTDRDEPVLVRGEGNTVWGADGQAYVDFNTGPSVAALGYSHPRVVDAVVGQARRLLFAPNRYLTEPLVALALRLASLLPGALRRSFFCNSGAEAVEGGVKLAKRYARSLGKTGAGVVALDHAFHGRLALSSTLGGSSRTKVGLETYANVPGVEHVMTPYCYRCPLTYPDCGLFCATTVAQALDHRMPGDAAAVILEPVLGVGGMIVPPDGYHAEVQRICRERGVPLILDEIFTGFGRTGRMFAAEHWNLTPDIMLIGKAMGGGLPLAAFSTSDTLADAMSPGWHNSTYGGNPTACAAGLATLDVIASERLPAVAAGLGERFLGQLRELAARHEAIGDVRGKGLMIGVELVEDRETKTPDVGLARHVLATLRANGILTSIGGTTGSVIRIAPPLTITPAEIDRFVTVLDEALSRRPASARAT